MRVVPLMANGTAASGRTSANINAWTVFFTFNPLGHGWDGAMRVQFYRDDPVGVCPFLGV